MLRNSRAVNLAGATIAAAQACNKILGTNYADSLLNYDKHGELLENSIWGNLDQGIPQLDVMLLANGQFAERHPKPKLAAKVQAAFDERLPHTQESALNHASDKLDEKLK